MNTGNGNGTGQIVNKAWSYAHVLRDDGLSYLAYTEQITFLLFLKMADEQTRPPYNRPPIVPPEWGWPSLLSRDGDELEAHYRRTLEQLGRQPGMLGQIFKRARAEIQDPAKLRRLIVDLIDREDWYALDADVKGDIYEGLLQKSAAESPKGAGQYFTPRELIKGIVDAMRPAPDDTVCDPACGTGGFLLLAYDYVSHHFAKTLDPDQKRHLRRDFVHGDAARPRRDRRRDRRRSAGRARCVRRHRGRPTGIGIGRLSRLSLRVCEKSWERGRLVRAPSGRRRLFTDPEVVHRGSRLSLR